MQPEVTNPPEVKKSWFTIVTAFVILFFLAAIGLGVWGYMLTEETKATRASEDALQIKFDALTKDKATLDGNLGTAQKDLEQAKQDLEQAKEDLEKAKKELAAQQDKLTTAQEEKTALQTNIDKAVKYLEVAKAYWADQAEPAEIRQWIKAVEDPDLLEKYEAYVKDSDKFLAWMSYLFSTVEDLLTVK